MKKAEFGQMIMVSLTLNPEGWEVVQKYSRVHQTKTEPDWMN